MVERALAAADAAEIEPQHREVAVRERIVELIDDLVIHRAPELRVRVKDDGDRRVLLPRRMEAAFDPSGGSGEDDLGHVGPRSQPARVRAKACPGLDPGGKPARRPEHAPLSSCEASAPTRLTHRACRRKYLELF